MRKCPKHPKYKAIHMPQAKCETCWAIYLGMCETCENCGCHIADEEQDIPEFEEDDNV